MGATVKKLMLRLLLPGLVSGSAAAAELDLADSPQGVVITGKPNVMLLIDTSKSMRWPGNGNIWGNTHADNDQQRIDVVRRVAKKLITDNPDVRFGLARLNGRHGGIIECPIGDKCIGYRHNTEFNPHHADYRNRSDIIFQAGESITDRLNRYTEIMLSNATPLAEAAYEITRYFRGMQSFNYASGVGSDDYKNQGKRPAGRQLAVPVAYSDIKTTYTSPLQYRCQKNFMVVLTDGDPVFDSSFPGLGGTTSDAFDTADNGHRLPDWDGDGQDGAYLYKDQENYWYLDDIARFAWDLDLKTEGKDNAGQLYSEVQQNIQTYTIGFAFSSNLLRDTASKGHGEYYTTGNATGLTEALNKTLDSIRSHSLSTASVAANSGKLQQGSKVYQARYDPADWSGQLLAYDIITNPQDGPVGSLKEKAVWEAGEKIPDDSRRVVITNSAEKGVKFAEGVLFNGDSKLINYIRGTEVDGYRSRSSRLGDIVNSAPVYVGQPAARYPESIEATSYKRFRTENLKRTPIIYVGANDGMLHGFNADGVEKLAYIPGSLLPELKQLADPDYNHQYYVDGSPTVVDAFISGQWRTILIGGLNAGGQSIYALDVTNPDDFKESSADNIFLWEFTDKHDADLGYTFSKPAIVKIKNTTGDAWYAVFGNGYNNTEVDGAASTTGEAAIYIVDLATGDLVSKILTGTGRQQDPTKQQRPNGMETLTPVDIDGDSIADAIYGGDLFGNVWKVDLSMGVPPNGSVASRLFTACADDQCGADYQPQPITSQLAVNRIDDKNIILFGTGKYIETGDGASAGVQSFYGIWDDGQTIVSGRKELLQQTINSEPSGSYVNASDNKSYDFKLRLTSDNKYTAKRKHKGWYIDLVSPAVGARGERVIQQPVLYNGRVIFVTTAFIPSDNFCVAGSSESWLMELDQETGGHPGINLFDLNGDGIFDDQDSVLKGNNKLKPNGLKFDGRLSNSTILNGSDGKVYGYNSGSQEIKDRQLNTVDDPAGRQQWMQFKRE